MPDTIKTGTILLIPDQGWDNLGLTRCDSKVSPVRLAGD